MNKTKHFIALSLVGAFTTLGVGCSAALDPQNEGTDPASDPGTEALATIEQKLCIDFNRYATAFKGNNGHLWVDTNKLWHGDTGGWVADKTSPSVAQLSGNQYVVAFSGTTCGNGCFIGDLWITTATANGQTGYDATTSYTHNYILPGTSPSVTRLPDNGYAVAYQDWYNQLWIFARHPNGTTSNEHAMCSPTAPCTMMSGTSPNISLRGDGTYDVAFQGADGHLWFYGPEYGARQTVYGMLGGTSPSLGWLSNNNDDATAFNSNVNNLWIVDGWWGFEDQTKQSTAAATSPSIATTGSSYQVAYINPSSKLCTWNAFQGGNANCGVLSGGIGVMAQTSPSIAVWPGTGGYQIAVQGSDGYLYYAGPACSKTNRQKQTAYLYNNSSPSIAVANLTY